MFFAIPDNKTLPQIGTFRTYTAMSRSADAAFGEGKWEPSIEQDTSLRCIQTDGPEWEAIVADRIVANRAAFEREAGSPVVEIRMIKAYFHMVGCSFEEARVVITAAIDREEAAAKAAVVSA